VIELVVVGLSHRTAPLEVRERAALDAAAHAPALARAVALSRALGGGGDGEALLLSTCNRVELYLRAPDAQAARPHVAALLAEGRALDAATLDGHLYAHAREPAVAHLFRVAASLDSAVVGEPQILGQVKEAFERARTAGAIGPTLDALVQRAFAAAKRVRSETEVARASASVASAAVDLAARIFGELDGREVLVVGAGEMGTLAARHLRAAGCGRLLVANRTRERAEDLVRELAGDAGEAHALDALPALLARADIVVCSTGAAEPIVTRELVARAMRARKGRWLCLLDIAVPRDVDPAVSAIENVYLYDVDALGEVVDENLAARRREAEAAARILDEEVARAVQSFRSRGVVPTIRALRERFLEVARGEAERALGRMQGAGERERRELQALAEAIVGKLLHGPLTALKREAESEPLAAAVRTLFALETADVPMPAAEAEPPVEPESAPATTAAAAGVASVGERRP
jgi:glutamyl-tRNA reductase